MHVRGGKRVQIRPKRPQFAHFLEPISAALSTATCSFWCYSVHHRPEFSHGIFRRSLNLGDNCLWYVVYKLCIRLSSFEAFVWRITAMLQCGSMSSHPSTVVGIVNYNGGPIMPANKHRALISRRNNLCHCVWVARSSVRNTPT